MQIIDDSSAELGFRQQAYLGTTMGFAHVDLDEKELAIFETSLSSRVTCYSGKCLRYIKLRDNKAPVSIRPSKVNNRLQFERIGWWVKVNKFIFNLKKKVYFGITRHAVYIYISGEIKNTKIQIYE